MSISAQYDIALQLTLKAMEIGMIKLDKYGYDTDAEMETANALNVKQINDFYNACVKNLSE